MLFSIYFKQGRREFFTRWLATKDECNHRIKQLPIHTRIRIKNKTESQRSRERERRFLILFFLRRVFCRCEFVAKCKSRPMKLGSILVDGKNNHVCDWACVCVCLFVRFVCIQNLCSSDLNEMLNDIKFAKWLPQCGVPLIMLCE